MKVRRLFTNVFVVVMLCAFGNLGSAQESTSGSPTLAESDALKAAQEWASFVSEANVAGLEKLLSDNYMHVHGTALVESKAQFLEALKSGARKYELIKLQELNVRVFGSVAVVTGKFQLKAFSRGKTIEGLTRFGLVIVRTEKGNEVVSYQATPIPQQK